MQNIRLIRAAVKPAKRHEQTDRQTNRQTDKQTDANFIYIDRYIYIWKTIIRKSDIQPQLIAHAQIYRENITNTSGWIVVIYSKKQ